jgi:hypothetical protein
MLADQGWPINRETLRSWVGTHENRYLEIQQQELPRIYARIAEQSEQLVDELSRAEWELLEKLRTETPNLKPGDVAGALRNVTVSKAVNFDKASLARGRPTEIHETRQLTEILRSLTATAAAKVIDSTAEELEPTIPRQRGIADREPHD